MFFVPKEVCRWLTYEKDLIPSLLSSLANNGPEKKKKERKESSQEEIENGAKYRIRKGKRKYCGQ